MHEAAIQINVAKTMIDAADDPGLDGAATPVSEAGTPVVHARDLTLSRTAPDGNTVTILDGIDLDIRVGEVIGIAGPTGVGPNYAKVQNPP